jgi:hypothetical protein
MLPLGFKFDVDAVIVAGVAHRLDCSLLPADLPDEAAPLAWRRLPLRAMSPGVPALQSAVRDAP